MSIHQLIAAICPNVFCQPAARAQIKSILNEALITEDKLAYLKASKVSAPVEPNMIAVERLWEENLFDLPGQTSPIEQHTLTIDNPAEPLEPIYFDLINELAAHEGWTIEKLLDTASPTPSSSLSVDLSRRISFDQHEGSKLLLGMRQRIRTFVQEWQKWRSQKRQLAPYAQARNADDPAHESARHHLSHKWQELEHVFEAGREAAFEQWLRESELELRSQVQIGRDLLAGDLQELRLQANWLKPYLRSPANSHHNGNPAMVTAFNTAIFEIVLLVKLESSMEQRVQSGELPRMLLNPKHRRSAPVLVVEITFRAIPERAKTGAYSHRGRAELRFTSYALNVDEITILRRELQRNEWGEVLGMLETNLAGNLNALLNDLDELLTEPSGEMVVKGKSKTDDSNPFTALFDFSDWLGKSKALVSKQMVEPLKPDTEPEAVIRSLALLEARQRCLEIYNRSKETFKLPQF